VNRSRNDVARSRGTAHRDLPDVIVASARSCGSGEPDFSTTDHPTASPSGRPPKKAWDRRRPRRFIEPSFLVVVGAVILLAAQLTTSRDDPDTSRDGAPKHRPSAAYSLGPTEETPRLIAPDTASAGEKVPLLAYRYRGPCGPVILTFDDTPVVHRLTRHAGAHGSGWTEMFMTLDVPESATPGSHEIALYGPPPPSTEESDCVGGGGRRQQLATTTITLGPQVHSKPYRAP
jgi:hypothetical protein